MIRTFFWNLIVGDNVTAARWDGQLFRIRYPRDGRVAEDLRTSVRNWSSQSDKLLLTEFPVEGFLIRHMDIKLQAVRHGMEWRAFRKAMITNLAKDLVTTTVLLYGTPWMPALCHCRISYHELPNSKSLAFTLGPTDSHDTCHEGHTRGREFPPSCCGIIGACSVGTNLSSLSRLSGILVCGSRGLDRPH